MTAGKLSKIYRNWRETCLGVPEISQRSVVVSLMDGDQVCFCP